MYLVAHIEQVFGQITSILTRYPSNQRSLRHWF
jgi:hypothetical protein